MEVPANSVLSEIEEIVNRETRAWDTQDVALLLSIFHPDMVWPWPISPKDHNPVNWVLSLGKFDYTRWKKSYEGLFRDFSLKHNHRNIVKIVLSDEKDGAFAVVDINTLWIHKVSGELNNWKGRVCKVYSKVNGEWKMTMHTGTLDYDS